MYKTQMEAARKGIITNQMEVIAKKEFRSTEEIRELVAKGQIVICGNKQHKCVEPAGIGSMVKTKINVNLGVSRDCKNYDVEMEKSRKQSDLVRIQLWIYPLMVYSAF